MAVLDGYGGYGISVQPRFDPMWLEWVEAGHVYAEAHVRGGGEKGDSWRLGGSGVHKERGIEDYIACAQTLESLGWAKRGSVAAFGGSMGGVLLGGAITRAPQVFGAAIIQAGELNPSRLIASANGANQFAEVGDPRTSEGLHTVAAMDPYQRIKDATPYPAVLLIVGLNDHRVAPWESGKFGARLATASSSGRPIWFRTDGDMGHFNTAGSAQARELSDTFSFAEAVLGR
jgi:prolyl oligopeptidase